MKCFKVTVQMVSEWCADRWTYTVVAGSALVAINKAIATARREHRHRTWDAVELTKVGDVA